MQRQPPITELQTVQLNQ